MCVSSRMVMRGVTPPCGARYCETAGAELLARNCWRGVCIAASFTWEGEGCTSWIGNADLDRLLSYPQRHNLSSSWFPIHFVTARAHTRPHVGPMICTWALSSARGPDDVHVGSAAHAQVMGLTCVSRG